MRSDESKSIIRETEKRKLGLAHEVPVPQSKEQNRLILLEDDIGLVVDGSLATLKMQKTLDRCNDSCAEVDAQSI